MWFEHPEQFNTLGKNNQDEDRNRLTSWAADDADA